MSHKIDMKSYNIQKIKKDIENTQHNVEFAEGMINSITDPEAKQKIIEKNQQRKKEIESKIEDVNSRVFD